MHNFNSGFCTIHPNLCTIIKSIKKTKEKRCFTTQNLLLYISDDKAGMQEMHKGKSSFLFPSRKWRMIQMESKIVDNYESVTLHQSLLISKLFTVHYFEYMNDFSFPGEAHNFWEFLCVDKGEVDVVAGSRSLSLKKDEIIFTLPGWLMVPPCMSNVNNSIVYGFRTVLTIPSTLTD